MTEGSQSRLKFIREQFWYKMLPYELVNPTIKISLLAHASCVAAKKKIPLTTGGGV